MKGDVRGTTGCTSWLIHGGAHHAANALRCVALTVMVRILGTQAFAGVALALLAAGCAHGPSAAPVGSPVAVHDAAPAMEVPTLPAPTTQEEARRALEIAFAAEGVGDVELAAAQLDAVLGSDFLTDAGRMNVYWHAALAHRRLGNTEGERDALEGFWLSAQLVQLNEDEQARAQQAELMLKSLQRHAPAYVKATTGEQLVAR
jgi:hypothetical protein